MTVDGRMPVGRKVLIVGTRLSGMRGRVKKVEVYPNSPTRYLVESNAGHTWLREEQFEWVEE